MGYKKPKGECDAVKSGSIFILLKLEGQLISKLFEDFISGNLFNGLVLALGLNIL